MRRWYPIDIVGGRQLYFYYGYLPAIDEFGLSVSWGYVENWEPGMNRFRRSLCIVVPEWVRHPRDRIKHTLLIRKLRRMGTKQDYDETRMG